MFHIRGIIVLFCLLNLSASSTSLLPRSSPVWKHSSTLKLLEKSLHRAAQFYEQNYDKVNLDSIFGLRAAEGIMIL